MPYMVEQLDDLPAILVSLTGQFDWKNDIDAVRAEVIEHLEAIGDHPRIYRVTDFTGITLDFASVVQALASETEDEPGSTADPRLSQIYVGGDALVEFAAESVQQTQYGKLEVLHFHTLDEALVFLQAITG